MACDIPYHFARLTRGYSVEEVNGFNMRLDLTNDVGISKDLFMFKKREHMSTDFLRSQNILHVGDTVLDIGANIGYYALLESGLIGPSGQVYAIEPVSSNYRMLTENIKLNHITNIQTFHCAAGDENKKSEIYVASEGNISSLIYRKGPTIVRKESVDVIKVDDFIAKHGIKPALIRMDVEGYEKEIIKGMTATLLHGPKLLIEVHPRFMTAEELEGMFSTMQKNGYTDVITIEERNKLWMRRNGEVKPSLRWLTERIEGYDNALGVGRVRRMKLNDLRVTLKDRVSAFHVLIS